MPSRPIELRLSQRVLQVASCHRVAPNVLHLAIPSVTYECDINMKMDQYLKELAEHLIIPDETDEQFLARRGEYRRRQK